MVLPTEIRDREFQKFEDVSGEVTVRTKVVNVGNITIGAVEIKDQNSSLKADVEAGGAGKNGLVVGDGGDSLTVDAVNLDIRDIDNAQDDILVYGFDGAANKKVLVDASGVTAIQDNSGSITVDAVNLDIRDLSHVQDSTKIGDGTTLVDVIPASGTPVADRLAVDANISGGSLSVGIARYRPRFSTITTATVLTTAADTRLLLVTADGQLDSISLNMSNANGILILKVDAVEVLRIGISDAASGTIYDLGVVGAFVAVGCVIYARGTAHIIVQWTAPVDFTTSFEVLGRATATTSTVRGLIVGHRVKV